ncbi:MAG: DUF1592 domain-containing protein [Planctomycetota bacterium]|nr:MAG: DUF1592 domain-containing protein [Planctomycetota bacterium]
MGAFAVEAERGDTQACRVPLRLEAGPRRLSAAFTNDYWVPDVADRNMAIEAVSLAGPLAEDTLQRPDAYGQVMFVTPGQGANDAAQRTVARKVIGNFAAGAFRRPVNDEEFRRLMLLYEDSRQAGDTYEEAVRVVLSAVLVSPNFLYRSIANRHSDDPTRVYNLNDHELAARLSYFLWSSTPDDELTTLADRGKLADEATLRAQARRMLADPRADAFIENFAGQWLLLRNLDRLEIDTAAFPEYSAQLRADLRDEATMFFGDIVRSDRSIRALLDSRETFLNARLASHYGVEGVEGDDFRRVTLEPDSPRGGILTLGAVLTVTSNPTRTSPVKRGLYVLDQVLGGSATPAPGQYPPPRAVRRRPPRRRHPPPEARSPPHRPDLRHLPPPHGPDRPLDGKLRRPRPLARQRIWATHRPLRRAPRRRAVLWPRRTPRDCAGTRGRFRRESH